MCRFRSLCSLDLAGFSDRLLDRLFGLSARATILDTSRSQAGWTLDSERNIASIPSKDGLFSTDSSPHVERPKEPDSPRPSEPCRRAQHSLVAAENLGSGDFAAIIRVLR